ncbi:MAG: HAD family hydrolase [Mycobacteriales bacterium]
MPPHLPNAVLFDVDGTLVDSNYQHVIAWVEAFRAGGYQVGAARLHRSLGMGSDQLIRAVLGRDDADVRRAHSNFYAPHLETLRPFPAARELLERTAALGLSVVLVTSASPQEAERLAAALGAEELVRSILDKGDVDAAKPDPELVNAGLRAAEVSADRALMIGDSVWDVQAAANAGVPTVALRSGGFSEEELRAAGAIAVYEDPEGLLAALDESPIAALAKESG